MSVTMKEIARVAGVSQQAVSAALRCGGSSKVSEKTRKRILDIAAELNYVGNLSAEYLRGKSVRAVGIIQARSPHAGYSTMLNAAICRLESLGYQSYVVLQESGGETRDSVRTLIARGVDGLLLLDCYCPAEVGKHRIPVLKVGSMTGSPELNIDKFNGGRLAAAHLLGHGFRKIGFLSNNTNYSSNEKFAGICAALTEAGCDPADAIPLITDGNRLFPEQLHAAIHQQKCQAFLCANDYLAGRLMRFCREHARRVPEDVAVIGFDGSSFGVFLEPVLTTVIQPFEALGARAAERMVELLQNPGGPPPSRELLQPQLLIGGSCGCPAPTSNDLDLFWNTMALTEEQHRRSTATQPITDTTQP